MKPLIHFVWRRDTRSSAVAERPRNASCESCHL